MQAYFELYREFDRKISFIINRNDDFAVHFHSNIEIMYVATGCVDATVRGVTQRLREGSVSVAAGYEPHGYSTVGESQVFVFLFPSESVPDFIARMSDSRFTSPFLAPCKRTEELVAIMERLRLYADQEITVTAKGYMYAILGILLEELGLSRKADGNPSELLIRKLLFYIEEHYREPISLADMAKQFGYHKDYLSKLFHTRIGCGFNRYVNLLRVRHAARLLSSGEGTLDEISFTSGFQCMKSFRRVFREHYGCTPYDYRRRQRK